MYRAINKLIKDVGETSVDLHERLVVIAHKAVKRKNYLIIDVMDMESMVDQDKVVPGPSMERVEVEK